MIALKKTLETFIVLGGLTLAAASANAQTVSTANNAAVNAGPVAAAHADQATVGVQNGNINVSGGVADGVRIGHNKIISGTNVKASVPVIDIVVPGASVVEKIVPHIHF